MPQALELLALRAAQLGRAQQHLAPHLADEVAHEVGRRQALQLALQLLRIQRAQALLVFLGLQQVGGAALGLGLALALFGDEAFQRLQLLFVDLDLVEVALDHFLHQRLDLAQHALGAVFVEGLEGRAERGDAVHEAPHRVLARREEARVAQRRAQHRQLQPRDLARHLRRHLGIGQDLVEQRADDVDHHVIELAGAGLAQFLAVRMDQVGQHGAAAAGPVAAATEVADLARADVGEGQAADHRHQGRVDLADGRAAAHAAGPRGTAEGAGVAAAGASAAVAAVVAAGYAAVAALAVAAVALVQPHRPAQRVVARDGTPGRAARFGGAHRQAGRLHAGLAQVGDDVGVGLLQQAGHRAADLGGQHLAHVGALGDVVDGAQHRIAHDLGAQRIAVVVAPLLAQQRRDVRAQFAQFPLAGVRDLEREAFRRDLALQFLVLDEAERVPGGGRGGLAGARRHLAQQALVEAFVEGQREDGRLAVQLELRAQQHVTLEHVVRGQRRQAEAFDRALGRRTRGVLDPLDGMLQWRGQSVDGVRVHACGQPPSMRQPPAPGVGPGPYLRDRASRISRSSSTSSGVGAGGAGGAGGWLRLSLLICLTIMKMMKARMMKFTETVMKLP